MKTETDEVKNKSSTVISLNKDNRCSVSHER